MPSSKLFPFPNTNLTPFPSSSISSPNPSLFPNFSLSFSLQLHRRTTHHHRHHHPLLATAPSAAPGPDQSQDIEQAQEALFEFLRGFGVSEEDSAAISENSPRYVGMLVEGVRDVEELQLWSSWKSEAGAGFKGKVLCIAKDKGDNGKVAFLESFVGLTLSSAMNVARYLFPETLPGLIAKANYLLNLFYFLFIF